MSWRAWRQDASRLLRGRRSSWISRWGRWRKKLNARNSVAWSVLPSSAPSWSGAAAEAPRPGCARAATGGCWDAAEMSGLGQLINTAWTGLDAAVQALDTVSNNTANVNTPGYNVESVQQAELPGGPGNGAGVTSIQRAYDQFVLAQMVGATSASQAAQVVQDNTQNLSAIFPVASGGAGGLGASLTSFFSAMNAVSQDPTSLPNRQALLSDANALAANFNSVGSQLAANLTSLNGQLTNAVAQVNSLTQQIAKYNTQIEAQTASGVSPPNALMDSRDNLVQQLGQELGVTVVAGPSNTLNIFTTGGAALVDGGTSSNLVAGSGAYGDGSLSIIYQPNGQDITASISG